MRIVQRRRALPQKQGSINVPAPQGCAQPIFGTPDIRMANVKQR